MQPALTITAHILTCMWLPCQGKLRLDAFLTAQVPSASRGKLQACIKAGNVIVNGKQELKTSVSVRPGDDIECTLLDAPVMQAIPEVRLHPNCPSRLATN